MSNIDLNSISTFLFDYDNTIVDVDEKGFFIEYISLAAKHFPELSVDLFRQCLIQGVQAMLGSDGSDVLSNIFEAKFSKLVPKIQRTEITPRFTEFYEKNFDSLKKYISSKPIAIKTIKELLDHNKEVIIATNPLYPKHAQLTRLKWIGLDQLNVPILITHAEQFHFTKPRTEYYTELSDFLDRDTKNMLMIGDQITHDIIPAKTVQMKTFLVKNKQPTTFLFNEEELVPPQKLEADEEGTIDDICLKIQEFLRKKT